MKRLLIISILGLAACGGTTERIVYVPESTTTTVPKVVKTTDAPIAEEWTDEDEFLFDFKEAYGNNSGLSDYDLLDSGYVTCAALRSGSTAYDVIDALNSSADGDPDIELMLSSIVASAVINLCPEQEYKFNS